MTNQDFKRPISPSPSAGQRPNDESVKKAGAERPMAEKVSHHAPDTLSSLSRQAAGLFDQQVGSAAEYLGHLAGSVKRAADELDANAPQLGRFAHLGADKIDELAASVKDKSAEDVWQAGSQYTRERPAIVFGLAAMAGFLAYRTFKNSARALPRRSHTAEESYGA